MPCSWSTFAAADRPGELWRGGGARYPRTVVHAGCRFRLGCRQQRFERRIEIDFHRALAEGNV